MISERFKKFKDYLAVTFLAVLSFSLNYFPKHLAEFDNLFHIASAELYKKGGLFFSDFRWESFSVFDTYKSDIWYGFHILMSFFISGEDYEFTGKIITAFLTFILLSSLYFVLRKVGVRWPLFWSVFLIFSSNGEIIRMTDLRPHILISALIIIFYYFLAWQKNRKYLFVTSLLFTFMEVSMIWLPISIFIFHWLSQNLAKIFKREWRDLLAEIKLGFLDVMPVVLGLIVGSFLRPNPIAGLYLTYYQIVYLFWVKLNGVVLPWGSELYRLNIDGLSSLLPLLFMTVVTFVVWFIYRNSSSFTERENKFIVATYFQAFAFTLIAIFIANRASDILSIFCTIAVATTFSFCYSKIPTTIRDRLVNKVILGTFFVVFFYVGLLSLIYYHSVYGRTVDSYRDTAMYLKENTEKGSVVAHLNFNDFSGLFLWNRHNTYQNHSDPIFKYAYNPTVYSQFLCGLVNVGSADDIYSNYVSRDEISEFCSNFEEKDLLRIIKEDMKADYVFIGEDQPLKIIKYFLAQPGAEVYFRGKYSIVFKIN